MTSPPCDSSITCVDLNTSLNPQTNDPPVNTSAENFAQIGLSEPGLLSTSGPSQPLNSATEVFPEKGPLETSYDYLFEGDLPIEKGTSSNILAHSDQFIIQSLTQMALGGERSPSSERTLSRYPSSVPKSLVLSSTPKWDGTLGVLNLQRNVENKADVSDDDQPLIWKVKKLAVHSHQKESVDQVRPPVTRSSSRRPMENALKDNQQKMTQRRKLKRKMIVEENVPVQPENVLDPEKGEKNPKDILLSTVNSRRRPGNSLAEDVPTKIVPSIRTKRNPLSTDRPSKGPGTSSVSKEVERLTALLSQRDAEIANLKVAQTEGPGPMQALRQENEELKAKVNELT
ncbi:hypothetical protein HAX54_040763 [Datura stramonium]|uniref:Uncharacterized protein n=1 Tax=Datura stramonium TaxID=4076 RepID=A0ABS8RNJ5_DATST|nr:hypothetical protein [Datura stramonium]